MIPRANSMEDIINTVDGNGKRTGSIGKLAAHEQGILHEAFSTFIFNSKGELLLQKRAIGKYHSGGLWTNTCCGHPRVGEGLLEGAERRLYEEMGISCKLEALFPFIYKVALDRGLTEHEYDYVCFGHFDGEPCLNPEEADAYEWKSLPGLLSAIETEPDRYTYWLRNILKAPEFNNAINNYLLITI